MKENVSADSFVPDRNKASGSAQSDSGETEIFSQSDGNNTSGSAQTDCMTPQTAVKGGDEIIPLSQSEQEHLTYLAVYEKYNEYKSKRLKYRTFGALFILLSGIVFLLLMFSLESKITFLCIWIITDILSVVLMLRADYLYNMYKEMLGKRDEFDDEILSELTDAPSDKESSENKVISASDSNSGTSSPNP